MRIKKSDLQKIINEAVLKEMAAGPAPQIIQMAKNNDKLRTAFLNQEMTAEEAAQTAATDFVKLETTRLKQEALHWGNLEYIAKELKRYWK